MQGLAHDRHPETGRIPAHLRCLHSRRRSALHLPAGFVTILVTSNRFGMLPQAIIERKRNGATLSTPELREFFSAFLRGDVAEYQLSAFLMAVYFRAQTHGA